MKDNSLVQNFALAAKSVRMRRCGRESGDRTVGIRGEICA